MKFKQTIKLSSLTIESVQNLQIGQYIHVYGSKARFIGIKDGIVQIISKNIGSYKYLTASRKLVEKTNKPAIQLYLW
tara:strand:- start:99 stop:329 length:231 start_codon:yes stop_codon:yes gene_type:complete